MTEAKPLLDLVIRVRAESGRPLDADGLARMTHKISLLSEAEVNEQRRMLKNLLGVATGQTIPNRDRP